MTEKSYPFWFVDSHTFVLGAGASRAAFPDGDRAGLKLPLVRDFIEVLQLNDLFARHGVEMRGRNIEELYGDLVAGNPEDPVLDQLNRRILDYFSLLQLPDEVTLYDELILSLQKKDAIFSFNWDPLLVQAYARNRIIGELPQMHFLHGNVAIGICEADERAGHLGNRCGKCKKPFSPSRLLYLLTSIQS